MMLRIEGGRALIDGGFRDASVSMDPESGTITGLDAAGGGDTRIDARGLLALPGIVDIHGDAFERQMMPRPGVHFSTDIALLDSDRQAIANGITTVFHGVTWSWEPGLRGADNARDMLASMERLRPQLAADTRFHLRHETFNLDAEAEIGSWLAQRRVDAVAFNDHIPPEDMHVKRPDKFNQMAQRAGLSHDGFLGVVKSVKARADAVPGSIRRIAALAIANGVPLLSHDDSTPDQRRWYRSIGCRVAEFPTTLETAQEAARAGDDIVLGAPNVVRGGSHVGWVNAADMVARGLCSVLASDYYYPAPLLAAFRLASDGVAPLERAWSLVSETPARAAGLTDRGRIAAGDRGDVVLVDAANPPRPRVVMAIVKGRPVYLADTSRVARA